MVVLFGIRRMFLGLQALRYHPHTKLEVLHLLLELHTERLELAASDLKIFFFTFSHSLVLHPPF
jgi:hypothetical protein